VIALDGAMLGKLSRPVRRPATTPSLIPSTLTAYKRFPRFPHS